MGGLRTALLFVNCARGSGDGLFASVRWAYHGYGDGPT